MLNSWHMQPTLVESGPEAINLLERQEFDLLLLDMQMPDMDGFEVAQEILRRWPSSKLRTLVLTSIGEHIDSERCRILKIDGYLAKPFKNSDLLQTVLKLFRPSSGATTDDPRTMSAIGVLDKMASDAPAVHLEILVAEDNVINQKLARRMLEKQGAFRHSGRGTVTKLSRRLSGKLLTLSSWTSKCPEWMAMKRQRKFVPARLAARELPLSR